MFRAERALRNSPRLKESVESVSAAVNAALIRSIGLTSSSYSSLDIVPSPLVSPSPNSVLIFSMSVAPTTPNVCNAERNSVLLREPERSASAPENARSTASARASSPVAVRLFAPFSPAAVAPFSPAPPFSPVVLGAAPTPPPLFEDAFPATKESTPVQHLSFFSLPVGFCVGALPNFSPPSEPTTPAFSSASGCRLRTTAAKSSFDRKPSASLSAPPNKLLACPSDLWMRSRPSAPRNSALSKELEWFSSESVKAVAMSSS